VGLQYVIMLERNTNIPSDRVSWCPCRYLLRKLELQVAEAAAKPSKIGHAKSQACTYLARLIDRRIRKAGTGTHGCSVPRPTSASSGRADCDCIPCFIK
jgi:hypothetical protein